MIKLLSDDSDSLTRLAALQTLGQLDTPAARTVLFETATHNKGDLQSHAIKSLCRMRAYSEVSKLLQMDKLSDTLKQSVVESVSQSSDGALFLITLIDEKRLSKPLTDAAVLAGPNIRT